MTHDATLEKKANLANAKKYFIVFANNPSDAFRCVRKFLPNLHKACKLEIEQLTPGNIEEVKFTQKFVENFNIWICLLTCTSV